MVPRDVCPVQCASLHALLAVVDFLPQAQDVNIESRGLEAAIIQHFFFLVACVH